MTTKTSVAIMHTIDRMRLQVAAVESERGRNLKAAEIMENVRLAWLSLTPTPTPFQLKLAESVLALSAKLIHEYRRQNGLLKESGRSSAVRF